MALRILILSAATFGLLAAPPATAIEPTTVARLIEPSMVRIIVEGPVGAAAASGFVVSPKGHIATAYHVVQPHIEGGGGAYLWRRAALYPRRAVRQRWFKPTPTRTWRC